AHPRSGPASRPSAAHSIRGNDLRHRRGHRRGSHQIPPALSGRRGVKLHVRATPNARTSGILGWEEDPLAGRVLRIRIAAPPTDGKANAALRDFLAKQLGLAKSRI